MARPKSGKKIIGLTLSLDGEMERLFREKCEQNDRTMAQQVTRLIREWLWPDHYIPRNQFIRFMSGSDNPTPEQVGFWGKEWEHSTANPENWKKRFSDDPFPHEGQLAGNLRSKGTKLTYGHVDRRGKKPGKQQGREPSAQSDQERKET